MPTSGRCCHMPPPALLCGLTRLNPCPKCVHPLNGPAASWTSLRHLSWRGDAIDGRTSDGWRPLRAAVSQLLREVRAGRVTIVRGSLGQLGEPRPDSAVAPAQLVARPRTSQAQRRSDDRRVRRSGRGRPPQVPSSPACPGTWARSGDPRQPLRRTRAKAATGCRMMSWRRTSEWGVSRHRNGMCRVIGMADLTERCVVRP